MVRLLHVLATLMICVAGVLGITGGTATGVSAGSTNRLENGSFENGAFSPTGSPTGWTRDAWDPSAVLTWDDSEAYTCSKSVKITASIPNDARWIQRVSVKPHTNYLLSGWVKTEDVAHTVEYVDLGANLSLLGTWEHHSVGLLGTNDWTYVAFAFNPGENSKVTVAARLGFWAGTTKGTAWFDGLQLTPIDATGLHPPWKILVLIYGTTDFKYVDNERKEHHVIGTMTEEEKEKAEDSATRFVEEDIPVLTSGNMIPTLTIRFPERPLTQLGPRDGGWWPDPESTTLERDPAFDSVIVIWEPWCIDQSTGELEFIADAAGLSPSMGTGQTYTTLIVDAATSYGHRNVFKHEWGHSIVAYYDATGTAPKPAVNIHINDTDNPYVHCPTGGPYILEDETEENPIPNSIYNNKSGFTHDYYSGTTARPNQRTCCLGITSEAWVTGGPVSKPPPPLLAPLNDDFDGAMAMGSLPFSHIQDTTWATTGEDDPTPSCWHPDGSVWYQYRAGTDSRVRFQTIGSDYDTWLAVLAGEPGSLVEVACNDDHDEGLQSQVDLTAVADTSYYVMIGGGDGETGCLVFEALELPEVIEVAVDVKPGSCPNSLNVKSKGVLPVAILGTQDFDVTQVDPVSVRLEGVSPLRWNWEDVATPSEPFTGKVECDDCNAEGGDGDLDLTLMFARQEVVAALGDVEDRDCLVLQLSGNLLEDFGGIPIEGEDVVLIKRKGTK